MSRLRKQIEAYRVARRIVRACNRMKAGQGVALQHCMKQRAVLEWMVQRVETGLRKRNNRYAYTVGNRTYYLREGETITVPLREIQGTDGGRYRLHITGGEVSSNA